MIRCLTQDKIKLYQYASQFSECDSTSATQTQNKVNFNQAIRYLILSIDRLILEIKSIGSLGCSIQKFNSH